MERLQMTIHSPNPMSKESEKMTNAPATITEAQAATAQAERMLKARVPFPLAGEDAFLHFSYRGIAALEDAASASVPDWRDRGFSAFGIIERLLLDGDMRVVRAALDAGLKRLGDDGKPTPMAELDIDELDWPLSSVVEPALEAICFTCHGKLYSELLAELTAARQAEEAERQKAKEEAA